MENNRFEIHYRLSATNLQQAEALAAAIALENTVEIPRDVVPAGYVEDVILGRVEAVSATARRCLAGTHQLSH